MCRGETLTYQAGVVERQIKISPQPIKRRALSHQNRPPLGDGGGRWVEVRQFWIGHGSYSSGVSALSGSILTTPNVPFSKISGVGLSKTGCDQPNAVILLNFATLLTPKI